MFVGIFFVVGVALSWAGSTQLASEVQSTPGFDAPFFMIYFNTGWMLLCFLYPVVMSYPRFHVRSTIQNCIKNDKLTLKVLGIYSTLFFLLWAAANYLYVRALAHSPPSVVTAVFSSTPAFVLLLSKIILKEPFNFLKGLSVLFCIAGIISVAAGQGFDDGSFTGVILTVFSAIFAAIYKVLLKKFLGDPTMITTAVFLVLLASTNVFGFWWLVILLEKTSAESIPWQEVPWGYLSLTAFGNLLFNGFVNFGIAYTDPLFISIGTILGKKHIYKHLYCTQQPFFFGTRELSIYVCTQFFLRTIKGT